SQWIVWILVFIFGFAFGFYETVYFAISMRVTDGRIAATMFSILMAVVNIGTGIGLGITGLMSDQMGFRWSFGVIALINLFAFALLGLIFSRNKNMKKDLEKAG
ncbi:MAG TPA: MFS transporter, partial [Pelolinea sp.]|nr:MFS transporter [Pelolinea sp.]